MRGMKLRRRLTFRRAAVSAALIAGGAVFLPIALLIDPNRSVVLFGLTIVAMAALPMSGIRVVFSRSWVDPCVVFAIASVVGMVFFLGFIS